MFALLENLGTGEMLLCALGALLVFGRRLPEVAAQAGATLSKFKRNLEGAIEESGVETEIRKIKQALPTDVSVRDVARAATKKVEDRMRALSAEADKIEQEVEDALKGSSDAPKGSEIAPNPPPKAPPPPEPPAGPPGSVPRE